MPPLVELKLNGKDVLEPILKFTRISKDRQHYLRDLKTTPVVKRSQVINYIPPLTYCVYMFQAIKNVIVTLCFEWSMPIFHPFNFLLLVTVFPTLIFIVILLEIALRLGNIFGLNDLLNKVGEKWGTGLSLVNWWDPRIFTPEMDKIVKDAIKALDSPLLPPTPERDLDDSIFGVGGVVQRDFDLDIAEFLLFISCIIYERDDELVRDAHSSLVENLSINCTGSQEGVDKVMQLLKKSEARIHKQAEDWGIKFTSLSELNSVGGPYSGMFWSEKHNFIVVVFKGTTPSNFEDFVVDLMFQRVDARSFVFGEVHEGFYSSLFPQSDYSITRTSRSSPYVTILRAIRSKAAEIQDSITHNKNEKINVWVTGHSLGAALASLFYARLIKAPEDLGTNCILRDGYVFGSPSIGDADFAAEFASHSNYPYDRQNTLWRIIDDVDLVDKLPPSWTDPSVRRVISKNSILNYAHVGEGIRFFQDGSRPACTRNLFSSGKEPVIIERKFSSFDIFDWHRSTTKDDQDDEKESTHQAFQAYEFEEGNPLSVVENLLPTFFRNHLPARYFAVMEKSRRYFDDDTSTSNYNQVEISDKSDESDESGERRESEEPEEFDGNSS